MGKNDRRQALKAIAAGAPAVWAKPFVNSVVLPTHALTTCDGNPSLSEITVFTPNPVQFDEFLRISTTVTNNGDVPLLVERVSGFQPFSSITDTTDEFPTTLNPGDTALYEVEGTASTCFGDQLDMSRYIMEFFYESCAGNGQLLIDIFTDCSQGN